MACVGHINQSFCSGVHANVCGTHWGYVTTRTITFSNVNVDSGEVIDLQDELNQLRTELNTEVDRLYRDLGLLLPVLDDPVDEIEIRALRDLYITIRGVLESVTGLVQYGDHTTGTYNNVPLYISSSSPENGREGAGSTGFGAEATVVVDGGGVVTNVTITNGGWGYAPLDILRVPREVIGGASSPTVTVNTIVGPTPPITDAEIAQGVVISPLTIQAMKDGLIARGQACGCNCNHQCTCQCNYSCTCYCNYTPPCTCQSDVPPICLCQTYVAPPPGCTCNYDCTCQCNYACTCNCNYRVSYSGYSDERLKTDVRYI